MIQMGGKKKELMEKVIIWQKVSLEPWDLKMGDWWKSWDQIREERGRKSKKSHIIREGCSRICIGGSALLFCDVNTKREYELARTAYLQSLRHCHWMLQVPIIFLRTRASAEGQGKTSSGSVCTRKRSFVMTLVAPCKSELCHLSLPSLLLPIL